MEFSSKYRLMLWKSYFDSGLSLTNYLKYVVGFIALKSLNIEKTIILVGFYVLFCFILGFFYFRFGWNEANIEVQNNYNIFVKEMRKKIGTPNKRKI